MPEFDIMLHLHFLPLKWPCKVASGAFHATSHKGKALAFAFSGFKWQNDTKNKFFLTMSGMMIL